MKRKLMTLLLTFFTLAMSAQNESIPVKYKGTAPNIGDFLVALLNDSDEDGDACESSFGECHGGIEDAWNRYKQGKAQKKNITFVVDLNNGYILYEDKFGNSKMRIEICYWNESDNKHKIVATSMAYYTNGKYNPGQYDGISFLRYSNSTKKLTYDSDFRSKFPYGGENYKIAYTLPRTGKDIIATSWYKNGTKKQKTIKWKGNGF